MAWGPRKGGYSDRPNWIATCAIISLRCTSFSILLPQWFSSAWKLLPYSTALLEFCMANPLSQGTQKSQLALECGVVGVNVRPWTAEHPNMSHSVIFARTIWNEEKIEAYYGTLVYTDLSKLLVSMSKDVMGTIIVLVMTYHRWVTAQHVSACWMIIVAPNTLARF